MKLGEEEREYMHIAYILNGGQQTSKRERERERMSVIDFGFADVCFCVLDDDYDEYDDWPCYSKSLKTVLVVT
ncbi:hypothetical protein RDWZM_004184, partial [Blomia tropicalis]